MIIVIIIYLNKKVFFKFKNPTFYSHQYKLSFKHVNDTHIKNLKFVPVIVNMSVTISSPQTKVQCAPSNEILILTE